MNIDLLNAVPGGPELVAWFGYAPRLHDAEVLSVALDRGDPSCVLRVHGFEMTDALDADGYFILTKHVVVTFLVSDLTEVELEGFNGQNAVDRIAIVRGLDAQYRLEIEGAYGLDGVIEGRRLEIRLEPGIPIGSQYHGRVQSPPRTAPGV